MPCAASQIFSAVAGMSMCFTPSALHMALMSVGGAAIAPASPQPFAPSGLCVQGVSVNPILNDGKSSDRGMQKSMNEPATNCPLSES